MHRVLHCLMLLLQNNVSNFQTINFNTINDKNLICGKLICNYWIIAQLHTLLIRVLWNQQQNQVSTFMHGTLHAFIRAWIKIIVNPLYFLVSYTTRNTEQFNWIDRSVERNVFTCPLLAFLSFIVIWFGFLLLFQNQTLRAIRFFSSWDPVFRVRLVDLKAPRSSRSFEQDWIWRTMKRCLWVIVACTQQVDSIMYTGFYFGADLNFLYEIIWFLRL